MLQKNMSNRHVKVTCFNTKTLKTDMLQCNASTKELKQKWLSPKLRYFKERPVLLTFDETTKIFIKHNKHTFKAEFCIHYLKVWSCFAYIFKICSM